MSYDENDLSLDLSAGQRVQLALSAGTLIACAEGAALLTEPGAAWSDGWSESAGVRFACSVALYAGQAQHVEYGGTVTLYTERGARVYCVAPVRPWRRFMRTSLQDFLKCAILLFSRRGVEQSGSSSGS